MVSCLDPWMVLHFFLLVRVPFDEIFVFQQGVPELLVLVDPVLPELRPKVNGTGDPEEEERALAIDSVSYTHLTLPTNREV